MTETQYAKEPARASWVEWPLDETMLVHATSSEAAKNILYRDKNNQLRAKFTAQQHPDFNLNLVWFGVPGAMNDDAREHFQYRYGVVVIIIDPQELSMYKITDRLPGRKYQAETSLPILATQTPSQQTDFASKKINFTWPKSKYYHPEVAVNGDVDVAVSRVSIERMHRGNAVRICRFRKDFCDCRLQNFGSSMMKVLKELYEKVQLEPWEIDRSVGLHQKETLLELSCLNQWHQLDEDPKDFLHEAPGSFLDGEQKVLKIFISAWKGAALTEELIRDWYDMDSKQKYPQICPNMEDVLPALLKIVKNEF